MSGTRHPKTDDRCSIGFPVIALVACAIVAAHWADNARGDILVAQPVQRTCLTSTTRFRLDMFLNHMWPNSSAVKGRIEIVSPAGHRVASRVATFRTGGFSLTYVPQSVGRYRIVYSWFIPRWYLARRRLRPESRAFYRVDRWQTVARFPSRVTSCR